MSIYFNGVAPMGDIDVVNMPRVTVVLDITGDMPAQYRIGYEYNGDRVWLDWADYTEDCIDVELPCGDGVYKILAELRDSDYFETDILETTVTVDAEQDMLELGQPNTGAFSFLYYGFDFIADIDARTVATGYELDIVYRCGSNKIGRVTLPVYSLCKPLIKDLVYEALLPLLSVSFQTEQLDKAYYLVFIVANRITQPNMSDGYYFVFGSAFHDTGHSNLLVKTSPNYHCYSEEWEAVSKEEGVEMTKGDLVAMIIQALGL